MLKRLYLVLIIYTLSAVFIEAKGPVKISGVVTDSENEPLASGDKRYDPLSIVCMPEVCFR